jgi:hypothetical protein
MVDFRISINILKILKNFVNIRMLDSKISINILKNFSEELSGLTKLLKR